MSEFGKGLTYCLGLFLAHAKMEPFKHSDGSTDYELWFNGATDHLFEIEVLPRRFFRRGKKLRKRLGIFQNKCLHWRLTLEERAATKEDYQWAIQEAKDLLLEIDKHFGIKVKKGQWE